MIIRTAAATAPLLIDHLVSGRHPVVHSIRPGEYTMSVEPGAPPLARFTPTLVPGTQQMVFTLTGMSDLATSIRCHLRGHRRVKRFTSRRVGARSETFVCVVES